MDPAVVGVLADAFRTAAQEPAHLKFLDNMDQPLILLDGPAYRAERAKTYAKERELLRKLNLLPTSFSSITPACGCPVNTKLARLVPTFSPWRGEHEGHQPWVSGKNCTR